jgi:hypothetical protein
MGKTTTRGKPSGVGWGVGVGVDVGDGVAVGVEVEVGDGDRLAITVGEEDATSMLGVATSWGKKLGRASHPERRR